MKQKQQEEGDKNKKEAESEVKEKKKEEEKEAPKSYVYTGMSHLSGFERGKQHSYLLQSCNMGHNQFQNIPQYILGSDPQKWAKLGEKMFKHTSNILFTQSKFVPC